MTPRCARWLLIGLVTASTIAPAFARTGPLPRTDPAGPGDPPAELAAAARDLEEERPGRAEERLRAWLAERPGDPLAHDLLGVALIRLGRHAEAEGHFVRAAEAGLAEARAHLARLYFLQGREPEAAEELRRAAEAGVVLERDLALKLAVAELAEGETDRAEARLRAVAERFDSVQALLLLARIELSRDEPAAALATLERARALAPNAEAVLDAEARAAFDADRLPRALTALDALARMHPTAPEYPYRLGLAQIRAGDLTGAIETLQRARDLEPDRPAIRVALGLALNVRDHHSEARTELEAALRFEPANAVALGGLSEAWAGLGDLEQAERLALHALELDPEQATAHLTLGIVYLEQERYAEARDALLAALAAHPDDPRAHYQLSLAYARLGETELSRRELERYRELQAEAEAETRGGM